MAPAARQSSSRVNCASDGGGREPAPVPLAPRGSPEPPPLPAPAAPDPPRHRPRPPAWIPSRPAPARRPRPADPARVPPRQPPRPRGQKRAPGAWPSAPGSPSPPGPARSRSPALADHPQGEVLVALGAEHEPQPGDVVLGELAVAGGRAVGLDQAGALEEADLGDGDVGELGLEDPQHLADAHRPGGAGRLGLAARPGGLSSTATRPGRHAALDRIPHNPTRHPLVDCRRRTPA